jgi:DNA-binding NarL/FixJ family response regulator
MSPVLPKIPTANLDLEAIEVASELPPREKIHALLIDSDSLDGLILENLAARSRQLDFVTTRLRSLPDVAVLLSERRFDVIYLEYWLGEETSVSFIHDVATAQGPPCVVLTDLDEPDIRRIAFRAGAQAFLSKDALSPHALESVTLTVLRQTLGASSAAA